MTHDGILGLILLLGLGGLIYLGVLTALTAWMLTHPPRRTYAWAVARGRPGDPGEMDNPRAFNTWHLGTQRNKIEVWDIPGRSPSPHAPVVIITAGWGDSRLGSLLRLGAVEPHAARVILWEMPGQGGSPGVCTLGLRETELLKALIAEVSRDGSRVVLYGWSMGAGVSIAAAADPGFADRIAGVIAEAPYREPRTPAARVMAQARLPHALNLSPALWLLGSLLGVGPRWRGFDRAGLAAGLGCPLMVLHGSADTVCPVEEGCAIAAAAADARLIEIDGAGHNDLWIDPSHRERCAAAVGGFLGGVLACGGEGPACA